MEVDPRVRKVLLVLAAVPVVVAPPALAQTDRSEGESVCEVPTVDTQYDVEQFVIHVSLPASGCASREHRIFELSAKVTRMDNNWGRDVHEWSTTCRVQGTERLSVVRAAFSSTGPTAVLNRPASTR